MMKALAVASCLLAPAGALMRPQPAAQKQSLSRRQLRGGALALPALALWTPTSALADVQPGAAADGATLPVYFGCGCFWHVQHEFVELERSVLKRPDLALSSRCGYAGGTRVGSGGKVCYHNFQQVADYGKLGHAEAVAMRLPPSALPEFAKLYFALFKAFPLPGRTVYDRVDPQDAGPEYRSVIGLPGGVKSKYFPVIEQANNGLFKLVEVRARARPVQLVRVLRPCPRQRLLPTRTQLIPQTPDTPPDRNGAAPQGVGNEPDTLLKRTVYVMDSDEFPFFPAESYHQFHNDFQSPAYGKAYNSLKDQLTQAGVMSDTGCPTGPLSL